MWRINLKGEMEFTGGRESFKEASKIAGLCEYFKIDDEDELVTEEAVSCYNCRYRRWNIESFTCCKK